MKDGKEVCAKTVNVNVQTPVEAGKGSVSYALNMNTTKIDTLVDDKHHTENDYKVTVDVTELIAGVPNATLQKDSKISDNADEAKRTTVKSIVYKVVDKDGKAIFDDVTKVDNVTNAAISATDEKLTIETVTFDTKPCRTNLLQTNNRIRQSDRVARTRMTQPLNNHSRQLMISTTSDCNMAHRQSVFRIQVQ